MPDNNNTYNFAKESISFGENQSIPKELSAENMIPDSVMNSAGLYSKSEIEVAKFNKFSRFGRVLDPYGRVNPGREFLFFVKPDLHICCPGNNPNDEVYRISGGESYRGKTGLYMNPQLTRNMYFRDLLDTHPDVVDQLQYSLHANDPFSHLLSFSVNSNLPLDSSTAKTIDTPSTIFATTYNYLQDSEASDEAYNFSLEFVDDKELNTYHFFKAYSDYHIERKSGLVTPPGLSYYQFKRLHNTMGIYKFIVAEDMETIIYWAYLWGVIPTSCPREAFQDPNFSDGLTFSVNFEAAFIEDMNPVILHTFNKLMLSKNENINVDNWLPIVRHNRQSTYDSKNANGYDPSIGFGGNKGSQYQIGSRDFIDGTLPSTALVDGRQIGNEKLKYRLRWYA